MNSKSSALTAVDNKSQNFSKRDVNHGSFDDSYERETSAG